MPTDKIEKPEDTGEGSRGRWKFWSRAISLAEKDQEKWETRAQKVVDRYRDERDSHGVQRKKFNILWSNIETLKPAIYARLPKTQVTRRFKDPDPVGKEAAEILERAVESAIDAYDMDGELRQVRDDYLLPGRGTARVRYIPEFGPPESLKVGLVQEEGKLVAEDGGSFDGNALRDSDGGLFALREFKPVIGEEVRCEYVFWRDFLHGPARIWREVNWVAYKSYMTRNALIERFGSDKGNKITLDFKPPNTDKKIADFFKRAVVYEIWDKTKKKVIWFSKGFDESLLDEKKPPLKLRNFFPSPRPLMAVTTTDTLRPIPEYTEYQDQADEIDDLTNRISNLTKALKLVGVYDASKEEIQRVLNEGFENQLIPVSDWAAFAQQGGLEGSVAWLPIDQVGKIVIALIEARDKIKQELFEISGIADVVRGSVDPREKFGQSKLKGQWTALRISDRQRAVARFIREIIELKAEIIAEEFQPETISRITGKEVTPEIMQLFQDEGVRIFRINIETDSTIAADDQGDKEARIEFLGVVSQALQTLVPMVQSGAIPLEMGKALLMFAVRGFKVGREIENILDELGKDQTVGALQGQVQQLTQQLEVSQAQVEESNKIIEGRVVEEGEETRRQEQKLAADQTRGQERMSFDDLQQRRDLAMQQFMKQVAEENKRSIALVQEETKRLVAGFNRKPTLPGDMDQAQIGQILQQVAGAFDDVVEQTKAFNDGVSALSNQLNTLSDDFNAPRAFKRDNNGRLIEVDGRSVERKGNKVIGLGQRKT